MARKVIGIAGSFRQTEDGGADEFYLNADYFDAVESAGATPLLIPPVNHDSALDQLIDRIGGLVIPGGADTPPWRYGQETHPKTRPIHPRRDIFDQRLITAALKRKMPILGICHGCQFLNVLFCGTLIQHLPNVRHHQRKGQPGLTHAANVMPGTMLASIVGAGQMEVNSSHHQAVDKLGEGLRAGAFSDDGVIEAIELEDKGPVLGVQWHPERMTGDPRQKKLFAWLLDAASPS